LGHEDPLNCLGQTGIDLAQTGVEFDKGARFLKWYPDQEADFSDHYLLSLQRGEEPFQRCDTGAGLAWTAPDHRERRKGGRHDPIVKDLHGGAVRRWARLL
jgi:hypothetical protein